MARLHAKVAVCSAQASKSEDRHAWFEPSGDDGWAAAVVCDGHNGAGCASFAARFLGPAFARACSHRRSDDADLWRKDVPNALRVAFAALHCAWADTHAAYGERCGGESPLPSLCRGGAAVTMCVFEENRVYVAHVGDAAAVAFTRCASAYAPKVPSWTVHGASGYESHALTRDHRVNDPFELLRLTAAGAPIASAGATSAAAAHSKQQQPSWAPPSNANTRQRGYLHAGKGPLRVWPGGLALSRTIGDFECHSSVHEAGPEVSIFVGPMDASARAHGIRVVLASDGLWDADERMLAQQKLAEFVASGGANHEDGSSDCDDDDAPSDRSRRVRPSAEIEKTVRHGRALHSETSGETRQERNRHGEALLKASPGIASVVVTPIKSACLMAQYALATRGPVDDVTVMVVDLIPPRRARNAEDLPPIDERDSSKKASPGKSARGLSEDATAPIPIAKSGSASKLASILASSLRRLRPAATEEPQQQQQSSSAMPRTRPSKEPAASSPPALKSAAKNAKEQLRNGWHRTPVLFPSGPPDASLVESVRAYLVAGAGAVRNARAAETRADVDAAENGHDWMAAELCAFPQISCLSAEPRKSRPSDDGSFTSPLSMSTSPQDEAQLGRDYAECSTEATHEAGSVYAAQEHARYKVPTFARIVRKALKRVVSGSHNNLLSLSTAQHNSPSDETEREFTPPLSRNISSFGSEEDGFLRSASTASVNSFDQIAECLLPNSPALVHELLGAEFDGVPVALLEHETWLAARLDGP